ncbi:MAG: hypothetical protein ABJG14_12955 [Sulfitobacter sp.]|uniref:DoxX family membrane protein n=1 Tax=Sulfitobacter sp. TaxID=1903071 RepID=UPI003267E1FD
MAAKRPARASLRYAKAPLSPRYQRELHQLLGHCSRRTGTLIRKYTTTFETNANVGATLARMSHGSILLGHSLLKLFVFTLPGTLAFFGSLGLPTITAYLSLFVASPCSAL